MPVQVRTVSELAARAVHDPQLVQQLQDNPIATLAAIATPLQNDAWIYRIVVGSLGLAVLIALIGAIVLAMGGNKETPAILTAIGSASVGALAGLLAPSPVKG